MMSFLTVVFTVRHTALDQATILKYGTKKWNTAKILTLCLHTRRQAISHDDTLPNQGDSGGRSVVFVVIVHVVVVVAANLGARKLHPVHNPCECKIHVVVLGVAWLLFCTAAREVAIISKSIEVIPSDSPIHGDRGYCVGQIMSVGHLQLQQQH